MTNSNITDDAQLSFALGDKPKTPLMYVSLDPIKVSDVFDTYWYFAFERQKIFFKRLQGQPSPWTNDLILRKHRFTNAYRASDRVSQYLIRSVIYRDDLPSTVHEVFFRIMLFKLFNKIETWQMLEEKLGHLTWEEYDYDRYDEVLSNAMAEGKRIYSAAYIIPSAGRAFGKSYKHQNHLLLLESMIEKRVPERLNQVPNMQEAFELLKSFPSLGDFLAYQFVTDVNYSEITDFGEQDFVVPGPGARDGMAKVFVDTGGLNEPELIKFMSDRQEREFERLGLDFPLLFGRRLQLIDCQNLFCEVDKYSRVAHPNISGLSGRTRIKQIFREKVEPFVPFYPPKWGINDLIEEWKNGI